MVLLQALVVAAIGYGIGIGLAALFGVATCNTEISFFMPWQILVGTGIAVILISILASLLSIRRVMVLEPAIVFQG